MRKFRKNLLLFILALIAANASAQNATDIIKKVDAQMRGEKSSLSTMTMKIVRPTWERNVSFKAWSMGTDFSMVLITAPAGDKGQSFLKRSREMWNYNPKISRMIKLPPSMLSQGWMGSDFTNDDLLNQSSIVVDYKHVLETTETVEGHECFKIVLDPLPHAPVVWGKIIMWIHKEKYVQIKAEYFDEDNFLVKTELTKELKVIDGRNVPTYMELVPADDEGNKTVIIIDNIEFNIDIKESFFSQQNMKRLR